MWQATNTQQCRNRDVLEARSLLILPTTLLWMAMAQARVSYYSNKFTGTEYLLDGVPTCVYAPGMADCYDLKGVETMYFSNGTYTSEGLDVLTERRLEYPFGWDQQRRMP